MATQPANDITIYQPDAQVGELKLWRPPEDVLVEAQQAAQALQRRIANKDKPVIFNNQQYVENDDWQMLAHFFGYAPKVISTEFVEYGEVQGFKAVAELVNERTGAVVSRGEGMCLDEEENWGPRTKYEWVEQLDASGKKIWDPKGGKNGQGSYKRARVEVGTVDTPLFQLMSMAQTRACNKAMSNKLKWVVTLAGYAPTPAEDMHEATLPPAKEETQPADDISTEVRRKPQTSASVSATANRTPAGAVGTGAGVATGAPVSASKKPLTPQTVAPTPQRQSSPQPRSPQPSRERVITERQVRRFYAIWKQAGKTKEQVEHYLHEVIGVQSDREIPHARYEEACAWAERGGDKW